MQRDAVEPIEGRLLFGIASEDADVDAGVAKVRTDLRARHRDEADYPGILCRFSEEGGYLDADRFGDAVRSTRVTQTRQPPKSVFEQPAPSGSTRARRRP